MASVFIIDDSQDIQFLFSTLLQMEKHSPSTASSGTEAIEKLRSGLKPDLILLDLHLQDASGLDLLKDMEAQFPEVIKNAPVVFITGVDRVPPSRAIGFIRKPIENRQFIEVVKKYLAQAGKC